MCLVFSKRTLCLSTAVPLFFSQGCSTKYSIKSTEYDGYEGEINQHTRLIQATRSQIFRVLTQEEAFQEICLEGTIVTHESPPPYGVGTLVKTRIVHIFKLDWNARVEEVFPDSKIRLQFLDGFFAGGMEIWKLESKGEYTRVTHTIIIKPKGFLRKLAWILKVRRKHNEMVEIFLDNLKRVCERHRTE